MERLCVVDAVEVALGAATHLTGVDAAVVAALRQLAARVDLLDEAGWVVYGKLDNVTLPTFLRYCEALLLTPLSRKVDAKLGGGVSERKATLTALRAQRPAGRAGTA